MLDTPETADVAIAAFDGDAGLGDEDIRVVAESAGLAPSVHNTQPWRFVGRGSTIEVYAEAARRLAYLDPEGRQLAISCGAAIEYAHLGVRGLGRSCIVRLLPFGVAGSGPVATLTIGQAQPVSAEEQRLIDALPLRRTDRRPYDPRPVPADVLRRAADLVDARNCWLRVLDRPGDRVTAARLLHRAEEVEAADPRYLAELTAWRRSTAAADGVPAAAAPEWDVTASVSDIPLRDFSGRRLHPHPGPQESPPGIEHDTVVLVGSDNDSPLAWLRTGRAIGVAWLALAGDGVAVQPLGPATDAPATRAWLRRELGLLGQPQLMFRVGYGSAVPCTGRRPVGDTLHLVATP